MFILFNRYLKKGSTRSSSHYIAIYLQLKSRTTMINRIANDVNVSHDRGI